MRSKKNWIALADAFSIDVGWRSSPANTVLRLKTWSAGIVFVVGVIG